MTAGHRVIWSQGMFLQPHHFQQEGRYLDQQVDRRVRAGQPYAWGFAEVVLDEAQLALGRVALLRASGVLPDGTTFSIPDTDALPAPYAVPGDLHNETVCLAVPIARPGSNEVDFADGSADAMSRYVALDASLRDQVNAGDDPEPIQVAAPRLRLVREREADDGHARLAVVRVIERRADGQLVLDRGFIPAQTRIEASGQLAPMATLVHGLVQQRTKALAAQMGQLGHGVSEIADFLQLQLLNRSEPVLRQFAAAPSVHPWSFFLALVQLTGELVTFSSLRVPPEFPVYRHDDLQGCFTPVLLALREQLSAAITPHAEQIELVDRNHGVRTAVVNDAELLRSAGFILAVRAQLPVDQLRQRFPAQTKLGPLDRIRDLVHLQLPGITLLTLAVAPRQLPYHDGSHYFELDRHGELWQQFQRNGQLAMHVAGDFPGLELELWAIRQA
jgi:type VI secretion system protein ImpJ